MKRLAQAMLAVALPLVVAAPASAKEPVKAKICGASDCVETKDRGVLAIFAEGGGPPSEPPSDGAAWYRVRVVIDTGGGHRDGFMMAVAPRAGIAGFPVDPPGSYAWSEMTPAAAHAFIRVSRGLDARPPDTLPGLGAPTPGTAAAARVDEVVKPPAPVASAESGSGTWPWLIAVAIALLCASAAALVRRRRRHPHTGDTEPGATPPDPASA